MVETLPAASATTAADARKPASALPLPAPLMRLVAPVLPPRLPWPALAAALLTLLLLGWLALKPPERTPLFTGLPDADKAAVVAALEAAGLSVALDPRTGSVLLPPGDHARARMLLAGQGLPRAAPGGAELLDSLPLGASRAVEGARLKAAHELELARAIETLTSVDQARVLIAQPEPSPFVRERAPVTASVTLALAPGRALTDAQARAIVHLVAGAVPGLAPDNVAIADQTGRLLAGEGSDQGGPDEAEARRLKLQAALESRAREAILELLVPVVGRENLSAQVAIELDFAAREAAEERFEREGALRSEQVSRSSSSEPRAIGIPGALSNTMPSAATVAAAPPPAALPAPATTTTGSESATRNYELGRSVEVTRQAGGEVRRLTAAVIIRADALGPAAGRARRLAEIRGLVEGAIGYDPERGDRIAVAAKPFAPPAAGPPLWREPVVVESSKWLAAALVAVGLLAFVIRPLVRRLADLSRPARQGAGPQALPAPTEATAINYSAKLAEARMLAAADSLQATAVARRLLNQAT